MLLLLLQLAVVIGPDRLPLIQPVVDLLLDVDGYSGEPGVEPLELG